MKTAGIIAALSVCLAVAGVAHGQATLTWVGDDATNPTWWDIGTANWTTNGINRVA